EIRYQEHLAGTYNDLGLLLIRAMKNPKAAEGQYRKALDKLDELLKHSSANPEYRRKLAATFNNLGSALFELRYEVEAQAAIAKAAGHWQKLADDFPRVLLYQQELALTRGNLARLLELDGRLGESAVEYARALEGMRKLVADYPTVPDFHSG